MVGRRWLPQWHFNLPHTLFICIYILMSWYGFPPRKQHSRVANVFVSYACMFKRDLLTPSQKSIANIFKSYCVPNLRFQMPHSNRLQSFPYISDIFFDLWYCMRNAPYNKSVLPPRVCSIPLNNQLFMWTAFSQESLSRNDIWFIVPTTSIMASRSKWWNTLCLKVFWKLF